MTAITASMIVTGVRGKVILGWEQPAIFYPSAPTVLKAGEGFDRPWPISRRE